MPRIKERKPITSVWSSYGHRFMSTDHETHEACLTCGAMYELQPVPGDWSRGEYMAANGDQPMECTGDTGMAHGYPGERYCHEQQLPLDRSDHECPHVDHDCNCLFCA